MGNLVVPTEQSFSHLEARVIMPGISESDASFFVDVHNHHWKDFFEIDESTFRQRLDSGQLFIGAYAGNVPLGLLETIALSIDEGEIEKIPFDDSPYKYSALQVAELSPQSYNQLTNYGKWSPFREKSNVLWLVDITSSHLHRNIGAGGKMVDFVLLEILKEKRVRIPQLKDINYVHTFTPSNDHGTQSSTPWLFDNTREVVPFYENSQKFHYEHGAFCTYHLISNARKNHTPPHVMPMCYLSPGYEHILKAKVAARLNL